MVGSWGGSRDCRRHHRYPYESRPVHALQCRRPLRCQTHRSPHDLIAHNKLCASPTTPIAYYLRHDLVRVLCVLEVRAVSFPQRSVDLIKAHSRRRPAIDVVTALLGGLVEPGVERQTTCSPRSSQQAMSPMPLVMDQHANLLFVDILSCLTNLASPALQKMIMTASSMTNSSTLKSGSNSGSFATIQPMSSQSAPPRAHVLGDGAGYLANSRTRLDVPRHVFDAVWPEPLCDRDIRPLISSRRSLGVEPQG